MTLYKECLEKVICEDAFHVTTMKGMFVTYESKYYSKSKKDWPTADDFERAVLKCGFGFKPKERKFRLNNGLLTVYHD